jgi:hypothetical protein
VAPSATIISRQIVPRKEFPAHSGFLLRGAGVPSRPAPIVAAASASAPSQPEAMAMAWAGEWEEVGEEEAEAQAEAGRC